MHTHSHHNASGLQLDNGTAAPDGTVYPLSDVKLQYIDRPHAYHRQYEAQALRDWTKHIAQKPALFNGTVIHFDQVDLKDGVLHANCHPMPYASFLHWRSNEDRFGSHMFPLGLMVTQDNRIIVGRMAEHTFMGGRIYAPSGSFDMSDLADGLIDPLGNIIREVREETGFQLEHRRAESNGFLFVSDIHLVIVYIFHLDQPSDAICSQMTEFIQNDPEAELDKVFAIGQEDAYDSNMPAYMPLILNWYFDRV